MVPSSQSVPDQKNHLYYGDNYEVLQRYIKDESVDLIYLDPPFNSRQDYNVLFAEAGFYKSTDGSTYPRLQILTIQQILDGKQPQYPLHRRDATFKKAPRSRAAAAENLTLPLLPPE